MEKIVYASKISTKVRETPSMKADVVDMLSDKKGLPFIQMTTLTNGHLWFVVRLENGKPAYVRRDVGKVIEHKTTEPKGAKLKYLIVHCTATPEGRSVIKEDIIRWHTNPVSKGGRGWSKVGYSRLITLEGDLVLMNDYNENDVVEPWEITNGAVGKNSVSRHIVYAGGLDKDGKTAKDTRNFRQKNTLNLYTLDVIAKHPDILVAGHNQFAAKACPSFDTVTWLRSIGVEEKNIYKK